MNNANRNNVNHLTIFLNAALNAYSDFNILLLVFDNIMLDMCILYECPNIYFTWPPTVCPPLGNTMATSISQAMPLLALFQAQTKQSFQAQQSGWSMSSVSYYVARLHCHYYLESGVDYVVCLSSA